MNRPPNIGTRGAINLRWLVRLRWAAVLGQMVTIAIGRWVIGLPLQMAVLTGFVAISVVSNLALHVWLRRDVRSGSSEGAERPRVEDAAYDAIFGVIMLLDITILTLLLAAAGGPSNPFSVFYLVHVVLAAVLLRPAWAWAACTASIFGYALIFPVHIPVAGLSMGHSGPDHGQGSSPPQTPIVFPVSGGPSGHTHSHGADDGSTDPLHNLHLQGMLLAFAAAGAFMIYFIGRIVRERAMAEAALQVEQERNTRTERLQSLATLAAGAAHELASPLATVAVAATELSHALQDDSPDYGELREDVRLIQEEIARCRGILDDMAAAAGQTPLDQPENFLLPELINLMIAQSIDHSRVTVEYLTPCNLPVQVPVRSLTRAMASLLNNALLATPASVQLRVSGHETLPAQPPLQGSRPAVSIAIVDQGPGIPDEVLRRIGEPFFTTRETGKGMGLGVYIARSLVSQLGGQLRFESESGVGTTVTVLLPVRRDRLPHPG